MLDIAGTDQQDPMIFCPGCKRGHVFHVAAVNQPNHRWTWNGDKVKPTFSPSMLVSPDDSKHRCHSYVRDGMIQFLPDCAHDLKNTTVQLQPFVFDEI